MESRESVQVKCTRRDRRRCAVRGYQKLNLSLSAVGKKSEGVRITEKFSIDTISINGIVPMCYFQDWLFWSVFSRSLHQAQDKLLRA